MGDENTNPMELHQEHVDERMNNVSMQNREMQEREERRDNIINPQEVPVRVQPVRLEVQEEALNAAQIKDVLAELDNIFSILGSKEKTKIKQYKDESEENKNFITRYNARNMLVKKMAQAVRVAKVRIAQTDLGGENLPLGEGELRQLNALIREAKRAKEQIKDEDVHLGNWKVYAENNDAMDKDMEEIVEDANRLTDSPEYKDVLTAIENYRRAKTPENFEMLQHHIAEYIRKKTHDGTKAESKFRPKGRARLRRMKDLALRLAFIEHQTKYKDRARMTEANQVQNKRSVANDMIRSEKLEAARQKMQEAFESERQFDCLKAPSQLMITESMLEPEYILENLEEMKEYARQISLAKIFKENWLKNQRRRPAGAVKTEREIFEDNVFTYYEEVSRPAMDIFANLADYIKACEKGNQKKIRTLREKMSQVAGVSNSVGPTYEGREFCRNYYDDMAIRRMEALRLEYIVGAYGETIYGKTLGKDQDRIARALNAVRLNAQGEFASEADQRNFEKDFELMDAMYNGSKEEFYELAEKYIEEVPMLPKIKELGTVEYLEAHFMELSERMLKDSMRANIRDIRPDVECMFNERKGEDYIIRINEIDGELGTQLSYALQAITKTYGFNYNRREFLPLGEEDFLELAQMNLSGGLRGINEELRRIAQQNAQQNNQQNAQQNVQQNAQQNAQQ